MPISCRNLYVQWFEMRSDCWFWIKHILFAQNVSNWDWAQIITFIYLLLSKAHSLQFITNYIHGSNHTSIFKLTKMYKQTVQKNWGKNQTKSHCSFSWYLWNCWQSLFKLSCGCPFFFFHLAIVFTLKLFYLINDAKRIRHKFFQLMKSSATYTIIIIITLC